MALSKCTLALALIMTFCLHGMLALESCRFGDAGNHNELQHTDIPIFMTINRAPDIKNPWPLSLLKITRLYNPTTRIVLFTNAGVIRDAAPDFLPSLADARIDVRLIESYDWKGSLLDRFHNSVPFGYETEMVDRFFAYHAEAERQGWNRLMAIDADMGLFTTASDLAAAYSEDLVTMCPHTSQFILINKLDALKQYCEFAATFFKLDVATQTANIQYTCRAMDLNGIHDMNLLVMFLSQFPSLVSKRLLCPDRPGIPACNGCQWECRSSSQIEAVGSFWTVALNQSDPRSARNACHNMTMFNEIVQWRQNAQGLPVPHHRGTGACFPIIHFQGGCKRFIPHFVKHYYHILQGAFNTTPGHW